MFPVFLNVQSTGLTQKSEIISFALTNLFGDYLYVEIPEFDKSKCDDWIEENVIEALKYQDFLNPINHEFIFDYRSPIERNNQDKFIVEKNSEITLESITEAWLKSNLIRSNNQKLTIVTDCGSYAWVLFAEIFGGFFGENSNFPNFVSPYSHDFNQDLANFCKVDSSTAFEIDRYEFAKYKTEKKFNALEKTRCLRACWLKLEQKRILVAGSQRFKEQKQYAINYFKEQNHIVSETCELWEQNNKRDRQINSLILNREIDLLYVVNGDEKNEHIGVVSTGFMKLANTMQIPIITNKQPTDKDYLDWITKTLTPQQVIEEYFG